MPVFKEIMIGTTFNNLTVVEDLGMVLNPDWACKKKLHLLRLLCKCGNESIVPLSALNSGITKSCGCLRKEILGTIRIKHGLYKHPLFRIWLGINKRCSNINDSIFKNYGGRGIKVCEDWRNDFLAFYNWAIEHKWQKGLQIDRIDNNGGYEPSNCRIVTPKENCNNKRNNRIWEYDGMRLTVTQWGELKGIEFGTLHSRVYRYNWTIERALNTP